MIEDKGKMQIASRDFSNYQVVRQEFGSTPEEVQISFNRGRFYINSYGLEQFPNENYIQILVDDKSQTVVIKPLTEKKRDSFLWCGGLKKRKPRRVISLPLCYLLFSMMNWNWNARYRITGEIEDYGEDRVIFFDLHRAVCFIKTQTGDDSGGDIIIESKMPEKWTESFGMPYEDYSKRKDIKTVESVSVFDEKLEIKRDKVKRMKEISEAQENITLKEAGENVNEEAT